MRPMWYQFPKDNETYTLNEQFMIGESLMVCPVTVQDDTETNTAITVYFPSGTWFVYQLSVWGGGGFVFPIIVPYIINLMYTPVFIGTIITMETAFIPVKEIVPSSRPDSIISTCLSSTVPFSLLRYSSSSSTYPAFVVF